MSSRTTRKCRFVSSTPSPPASRKCAKCSNEATRRAGDSGRRTILFVDEMHRFNQAQQDVLLPDVEEGGVILIGATTQNPFFAINSPLLSRSQIFTFEPLTREHIKTLLHARSGRQGTRPRRHRGEHATDDALDFLAEISDGDARRALDGPGSRRAVGTDAASRSSSRCEVAQDSIQRKVLDYDPTGDTHYDVASAVHQEHARQRSGRGDLLAGPDARSRRGPAVHRPADRDSAPREDVGNADPQALVVAAAALQAVEFVGLPECQLHAGPSGHLHRHGAEIERRDGGHRRRPARTCRRAARCRCRSICATAITAGPNSSATARATSTATITKAASWIRNICRKNAATTNRWIADMRRRSRSGWRN